MGFFDDVPLPPVDDEDGSPPRLFWQRSDLVLGAPVPLAFVLARSADAVVCVSGVVAHPNGFELTVAYVLRQPDPDDRRRHPMWPPGHSASGDLARFGLRFSDGTRVTNLDTGWYDDADPPKALMHGRGGGGDERRWDDHHWVWPLPPSGPLMFVCEWPAYGIAESRLSIEGDLIRDAAARAVQLWPETDG